MRLKLYSRAVCNCTHQQPGVALRPIEALVLNKAEIELEKWVLHIDELIII